MEVLKLIFSTRGVILILGICIFIAFMIHHKFFENLRFKFKNKNRKIEIESESKALIEAEEKGGVDLTASLPEKKEEFEEEVKEDDQEILNQAIEAYEDKDIEKFTKNWEAVTEKLDGPLKSKFIVIKFYHRYNLGDQKAIEELKKLIDKDGELAKLAREYLAEIYQSLDKTEDAIDLINKNIEISEELEDKLFYSLKLCDLKIEKKEYKETEEILKKLKDEYHDSIDVSKIMEKFGELYEEMEKLEIALHYYEKALELNPTNDSLRFNIAYKYSSINQYEMSLFYYKMLDSHNYDLKNVKNNLGVCYSNLEMPIKGVKYYQDAIKEGSTLASSNIGYKYINLGFIDSAKEILNKALENEHVHPNVNEALAYIKKRKTQEKELEKKLLELAKAKKEFSLKICNSFEYKANITYERLVGKWNSTLSDINFIKNEKIKGQFKYKYNDVTLEEQELNKSVFKFRWKRGTFFLEEGTGILIFSEDGNKFEGLLIDFPENNEFISFTGNKA